MLFLVCARKFAKQSLHQEITGSVGRLNQPHFHNSTQNDAQSFEPSGKWSCHPQITPLRKPKRPIHIVVVVLFWRANY